MQRYAEAAKSAELCAETLHDDALVHAIVASVQERELPPLSEQRAQLARQRARIEAWLGEKPALKLSKVHVLLTRDGVNASYATLRRFAIDELGWGRRAPTVRIDDCGPGEEAQIDFGSMGLMHDPETGRSRKLWALIVTLVHSRYQFVYPTFEQTLRVVCDGLDAAWCFFEGVPQRIVTSNRDTSEWLATFDDVLLAQSAVDRFKNAAFDLVVEGESYRPRQKPGVRDDDPPPSAPVSKPDHPIKRRKR